MILGGNNVMWKIKFKKFSYSTLSRLYAITPLVGGLMHPVYFSYFFKTD